MKRIAFDVMGNDNGLAPAVTAVNEFVQQHDDFHFILVGDKTLIEKYLKASLRVEILDVKIVASHAHGLKAARDVNSSMFQAVELVRTGAADLVISSGDSGIYLAIATLNLKRLANVKRPAFMPVFPTIVPHKKFVMADVGANLDVTPLMLVQWAKIATIFSQRILNVPNPVVAIVNVGHEKHKGKDFHTKAYAMLEQDSTINFSGFVEPHDLLRGKVDVVISDGYGGNMILKTMEGAIFSLVTVIKQTLMSKLRYKIGALLIKDAFQTIKTRLDYRNVGLAWVIGLNKLVIKCHGSADQASYLGAFNQIKISLDRGLEAAFQKEQYA